LITKLFTILQKGGLILKTNSKSAYIKIYSYATIETILSMRTRSGIKNLWLWVRRFGKINQ